MERKKNRQIGGVSKNKDFLSKSSASPIDCSRESSGLELKSEARDLK